MSAQPKALRLADELDQYLYTVPAHPLCTDVSDELRRLHAQRDALLEALKRVCAHCARTGAEIQADWDAARAAIKAVEENT